MPWKKLVSQEVRHVGSARRLVLLLLALLVANLVAASVLHLSHHTEHSLELEGLDAIARSRAASQRIALLASRADSAAQNSVFQDEWRQEIRALAGEIQMAVELTSAPPEELPTSALSFVDLARRLAATPWEDEALRSDLAAELVAAAEPTLATLDHLVFLRRGELLDESHLARRTAWVSFFALSGLLIASHLVLLFPTLRRIEDGSQELARHCDSTQQDYRSIFERHPLPIFVFDDGSRRVVDVNDAAKVQYGWSPDEFCALRFEDLLTPADAETLPQTLHRTDGPVGGAWVQVRKNGTSFPADVYVSPPNAAQRRIAVVADASSREDARRRLEWEEAWFQGIAESLAEAVVVADLDGTVVYCNGRVQEITGLVPQELVGRPVDEFLAAGTEAFAQRLQRRAEGLSETYQEQVRCADGRILQVQVHASPLRDVDGAVYGVVAAFSDVTERIEMEHRLQRRESELTTIFRQIPARLWSTDRELRVTSLSGANPGLGFSHDQLVGKTIGEMVDEGVLPQVALEVHRAALRGEAGSYRADFGATVFRSRVEPLRDAEGRIVGTIGVGLDVSEAVEARRQRDTLDEQLRQAQKMESVGRLAGGVAHDFNNLLSAILGWAELLEARLGDDGREEIEEIISAARTAGSVTRQLLAFGRQEVCEPRILELNDAIQDVEKLLRRVIGEDVELDVECSDEVDRVEIDPVQLQQILLNLAVNARDAMPDGGRLEIRTRRIASEDGTWFALVVRDDGVGMDDATRERIFEPFFTTKERGRGTGLGLSTVQGLVGQNGGRITVWSEPGRGAEFTVLFPRADRLERATVDARPGVESAGFGDRILVVEDEAALRIPLCRGLRQRGFEVFGAADADEAKAIYQTQGPKTFRLLMTDIVMPGRFGDDLATELEASNPNLKVLFISGYSGDRLRGRRRGRQILTKPFGLDEVQEKILAVLHGRDDAPSKEPGEGPGDVPRPGSLAVN